MTQEPEVQFITYPAPSAGEDYALPWRYLAASEHEVVFEDTDGNVVQTLVSGVDWTISPDADTGANVGLLALIATPGADVAAMTITRNTTAKQDYVATPGAEGVATALDRNVLNLQDQERRVQRVPVLPPGTPLDGAVLPNPVAGAALVGRADGAGWEAGPNAEDIADAQANAQLALDAKIAAADSAAEAALYDGNSVSTRTQTQRLMQRLKNDDADCSLVVFSDSTGDALTEWVRLIAGRLATAWPTFTVNYRIWDSGASPENYSAIVETVQTGTGANTLTIWNAAVPGSVANHFSGLRFTNAILQSQNPDLVILNYGHNGGTSAQTQVEMHNTLLGRLTAELPDIPVILTGQNPWLDGTGGTLAKVDALASLASRRGLGFVNTYAAFLQSGTALADLMADNVHPNAAGQVVWADEVEKALAWKGGDAAGPISAGMDGYVIAAVHHFSEFNAWAKSGNAATAENVIEFETLGQSTKLSNTSGASGWILKDLVSSQDVIAYRGKYVTLALRRYIADGEGSSAGRIELEDGVGSEITSGGGVQGNVFAWHFVTLKIDVLATRIRAYIYASSDATTEELSLDRAILCVGTLPMDSPPPQLQNFMRGAQFFGSSADGLVTLRNNTDGNIGMTFLSTATGADDDDPSSRYQVAIGGDSVAFKSRSDSDARLKIAPTTGRISWGDGAGTFDFYFQRNIATLMKYDGAHIYPETSNTWDLGIAGQEIRRLWLGTDLRVGGTKIIGAQGAAVADASGGATVDAEARTAINDLLARLRAHGVIAT